MLMFCLTNTIFVWFVYFLVNSWGLLNRYKKMNEIEIYLASIRAAYPDFVIEKASIRDRESQFNDILVINDAFIFRFPRYSQDIASLVVEIQLLKRLNGAISLPIPTPIFSNLDPSASGKVFMGYKMIPGEPLTREKLAAIPDGPTLRRLANQLASFLKELHTLPPDTLTAILPLEDGQQQWAVLYAGIQQDLYPFMRPDAQAQVTHHFERYLNDPLLHTFTPCLRHGDFGPSNILYDPQAQTITGILDFSSLAPGDPALDVASALCYGEPFLTRFSSAYPEIESMLERARFYKGTFALQEALHGARTGDRKAFESGMVEYKL
jgi:aminoglycoside 2''-phosphotransferase